MTEKPTPYQYRFGLDSVQPRESLRFGIINQQFARKTARKYHPDKKISEEQLNVLIEASMCAPTSGALQLYSILVLTTPEEKEKLFENPDNIHIIGGVESYNVNVIRDCSSFLIWVADLYRVDNMLSKLTDDQDILMQPQRAEYHLKAIIDAAIAAEAFSICAESIGLGTMFCGAIRQIDAEYFQHTFNFPKLTMPLFGLAVGYPNENRAAPPKTRLPSKMLVHQGQYNQKNNLDELKTHRNGRLDVTSDFTYTERLVERLAPSHSKKSVSNSLKHTGFKFE